MLQVFRDQGRFPLDPSQGRSMQRSLSATLSLHDENAPHFSKPNSGNTRRKEGIMIRSEVRTMDDAKVIQTSICLGVTGWLGTGAKDSTVCICHDYRKLNDRTINRILVH